MEKTIKSQVEQILKYLEIDSTVEVESTKTENYTIYNVKIKTEDGGKLIGFRGQTLKSFENIIINFQKTTEPFRISLDVNNYKDEHEEKLRQKAESSADIVKETKKEYDLGFMSASDRRIVHITIEKIEGLTTESIGEGKMKRILIKIKE